MDSMKIQVGPGTEILVWADEHGRLSITQDGQEVSIHLVQAVALAEFILANKADMTKNYKRHCKGKANGRGN